MMMTGASVWGAPFGAAALLPRPRASTSRRVARAQSQRRGRGPTVDAAAADAATPGPRPPMAPGGLPLLGHTLASLEEGFGVGINRLCCSAADAVRSSSVAADEKEMTEVFELSLPLLNSEGVAVVIGGEATRKLLMSEDATVRSAWPQSFGELLGPEGALLTISGDEHRRARRAAAGAISAANIEAPDNWGNLQRIVGSNLQAWVDASATSDAGLSSSSSASAAADSVSSSTALLPACRRLAFEVAVSSSVGPNAELSAEEIALMQGGFDAVSKGLFAPTIDCEHLPPEAAAWLTSVLFPENAAATAGRTVIDDILDAPLRRVLARSEAGESAEGDGMAGRVARAAAAEGVAGADLAWLKGFTVNMLFGGIETTAASLNALLPELYALPELTDALRADVEAAMPKAAAKAAQEGSAIEDVVAEITPDGLAAAPLLNAAVLEALRYFVVVPFSFREVIVEDLVVGGWHIPKGHTIILYSGTTLNEMSRPGGGAWDDPERFDPRRWLPALEDLPAGASVARTNKAFGGSFAPFGAGVRVCPGQVLATNELLMLLAAMLLTCDWVVPPGIGGIEPGQSPRAFRDRLANVRRGGDNGFQIELTRRRVHSS